MIKKKRVIAVIDENLCDGCEKCITVCMEDALKMVSGKARLLSELFCNGIGKCVHACPTGAIRLEKKDVDEYDEKKVMEHIVKHGTSMIVSHLDHLREHNAMEYQRQAMEYLKEHNIDFPVEEYIRKARDAADNLKLYAGCPGTRVESWGEDELPKHPTELRNWPVQLIFVNPGAAYLKGSEILLTAFCAPFSYADFHKDFIKDKIVIAACPHMDDLFMNIEKLKNIFTVAHPKSITVVYTEAECCYGMIAGTRRAIEESGMKIPIHEKKICIKDDWLLSG